MRSGRERCPKPRVGIGEGRKGCTAGGRDGSRHPALPGMMGWPPSHGAFPGRGACPAGQGPARSGLSPLYIHIFGNFPFVPHKQFRPNISLSTSGKAQIKSCSRQLRRELPPLWLLLPRQREIAPLVGGTGGTPGCRGRWAGSRTRTHHFPLAPLADPAEDDGDAKADGDDG